MAKKSSSWRRVVSLRSATIRPGTVLVGLVYMRDQVRGFDPGEDTPTLARRWVMDIHESNADELKAGTSIVLPNAAMLQRLLRSLSEDSVLLARISRNEQDITSSRGYTAGNYELEIDSE